MDGSGYQVRTAERYFKITESQYYLETISAFLALVWFDVTMRYSNVTLIHFDVSMIHFGVTMIHFGVSMIHFGVTWK